MKKTFETPFIESVLFEDEELCVMYGTLDEEKNSVSGSEKKSYARSPRPKDEFRKDSISEF